MKKILKLIIFIMTFFMMSNNCFAKTSYIKLGDTIPNVRLHLKTSDVEKNKNMYQIINRNTGDLVYCIEPGVMLNDGYFTEYSDISNTSLDITEEEWKYLTYIAFYGYNYRDRTDIKWYVATQFMIWDYLIGEEGEIYFIDENNNKIDLYRDEINAIQKDIDNMNVLPSFAKTSYEPSNPQYTLKLNEEITITDENSILSNFEVTPNNNNVKPIIDGNNITVSFPNVGDVLIFYTKEYKSGVGMPKIFYSSTSQSVMSRGNVNMPSGLTQFKIVNPSLKVIKSALEKTNLSLEGATYGIYYEDGVNYGTLKTDKDGVASLKEIWPGKYYLQELEAPYGYKLNEEKIYFEVTDKDVFIEINEELIKKNILIEKYLEDIDGSLKVETNAEFKIYDNISNELLDTFKTDPFGKINLKLPYGTYKIVQTKGEEGYLFVEDLIINVDEDFNESPIQIKNKQIVGNLIINKIDVDTKELIKDKATFKILNTDLNSYYTLNDNDIFETKDGVLKIKNIPYGNYKLIEITSPENYEILDNEITFRIENNKETTELQVENKKIMGSLVIKKIDRDTHEALHNVLFGIYNDKKELIHELYTNKDGVVKIGLKLGKYYIKELSGLDSYEINNQEFEVLINSKEGSEVVVQNEKLKGTLEIVKVDSLTNEPLANIKFGIYDENKELIHELNTNQDGKINLDLKLGTYYIKELLTLDNYELNDNEIEIEIKDNIKTIIKLTNRMKIEVPKTGTNEFFITVIISAFILLIGMFICNYDEES